MRAVIVLLIGLFYSVHTPGQVAMLDKVYAFIEQKQLEKAAEALSIAEKHTATANDARTFYLKAYVCKEFVNKTEGSVRHEWRQMAFDNVAKSNTLDNDSTYSLVLSQLSKYLWATQFNDASESFNAQRYIEAIAGFKKYLSGAVDETQQTIEANYFIATAFYNLNTLDSAIRYFEVVRKKNFREPALYVDLSEAYHKNNDERMCLLILEEGITSFPEHYDLQIAQLNILSAFKKYDTLEIKVDQYLKTHPEDQDVMLMAATTYMKTAHHENRSKQFDKSVKTYEKILALEPSHFDANYNLGVLYYNEAVEIVNKNDFDTDLTQLNIVLERSTSYFEKSLPLLLKIFDQHKSDLKLLKALQAIYYNLNMKDNLAQVTLMIKNLS